jgi:hypothetical protein
MSARPPVSAARYVEVYMILLVPVPKCYILAARTIGVPILSISLGELKICINVLIDAIVLHFLSGVFFETLSRDD